MVLRRVADGMRWRERARAQVLRELGEEADLGGDRAAQTVPAQVPASARATRWCIAVCGGRQSSERVGWRAHSFRERLVSRPTSVGIVPFRPL